jgi:CheY-like chemotaxis protein
MFKILLVDDNKNFRTCLAIGLRREGYEVEVFGNPVEAFNRIQECVFDVLLTDLRMPYFNGYELARLAVRHQPTLRIVLLSAYDFNDFIPEEKEAQTYLKLSKPFEMSNLVKLLTGMALERIKPNTTN